MTSKIVRALAALFLLAGAAPVAAQAADPAKPAAGRSCFWPREVNGFNTVDDRTVNLRVGVRDVYQLELLAPCPDMRWTENLGLDTRGSTMVCTGLDVTIVSPSTIGPQRCPARTVRKLSPQEVAALAKGDRP